MLILKLISPSSYLKLCLDINCWSDPLQLQKEGYTVIWLLWLSPGHFVKFSPAYSWVEAMPQLKSHLDSLRCKRPHFGLCKSDIRVEANIKSLVMLTGHKTIVEYRPSGLWHKILADLSQYVYLNLGATITHF